jgi:hypothetical protein
MVDRMADNSTKDAAALTWRDTREITVKDWRTLMMKTSSLKRRTVRPRRAPRPGHVSAVEDGLQKPDASTAPTVEDSTNTVQRRESSAIAPRQADRFALYPSDAEIYWRMNGRRRMCGR